MSPIPLHPIPGNHQYQFSVSMDWPVDHTARGLLCLFFCRRNSILFLKFSPVVAWNQNLIPFYGWIIYRCRLDRYLWSPIPWWASRWAPPAGDREQCGCELGLQALVWTPVFNFLSIRPGGQLFAHRVILCLTFPLEALSDSHQQCVSGRISPHLHQCLLFPIWGEGSHPRVG